MIVYAEVWEDGGGFFRCPREDETLVDFARACQSREDPFVGVVENDDETYTSLPLTSPLEPGEWEAEHVVPTDVVHAIHPKYGVERHYGWYRLKVPDWCECIDSQGATTGENRFLAGAMKYEEDMP